MFIRITNSIYFAPNSLCVLFLLQINLSNQLLLGLHTNTKEIFFVIRKWQFAHPKTKGNHIIECGSLVFLWRANKNTHSNIIMTTLSCRQQGARYTFRKGLFRLLWYMKCENSMQKLHYIIMKMEGGGHWSIITSTYRQLDIN